ncbi:hypothetical protein [Lewinella cohaerens]|uniref:hypothetical protein n=1 Tax=Lewinella cohaerens TaxID=70995 RepID=UPI0012EB6492|nr:hypothetical protein [Lewinella cohaerens]
MTIRTITSTFSMHSGDHDFYGKEVEFVNKLLFNCESMERIPPSNAEYGLEELSFTKYQLTGKVVFKGAYLLIIDCHIRIGVVLNNAFRFGNHVYMGNNEIDHRSTLVGDTLKLRGTFIFSPVHFCVFTFKRSEKELPIVDFKWKATKFYRYLSSDEEDLSETPIDTLSQSSFEEMDKLISNHNIADDLNVVELQLVSPDPVEIDQKFVGVSGYFSSINWITPSKWIKNCGGRILSGVKVDDWFYYDKHGIEKTEIHYERE